jgi:peptide/nickel transport system substrate-binding protein
LRYELYREADQVMINDAPVVPLWYDEWIHFTQPEIKNFNVNGLNLLELRNVYKGKK